VRRYRREWLRSDLAAGMALTALVVPAGIGYAQASGLPAVNGLHATIVALCVYALVGPSRIMVVGPDSSLVPLIAASLVALDHDRPEQTVAAAGLLAILTGLTLVVAGVARLGLITDLLSKPIRLGFLHGVALVVIVGQVPELAGFAIDADGVIDELRAIVEAAVDGAVDRRALVVGVSTLVAIVAFRRIGPRVPAMLVALSAATVAVWAFDWASTIPVVGRLDRAVPAPALGALRWDDLASLVPAALGIAMVAFADTGVLSRSYAAREGTEVDQSREMVAIGLTNAAVGLLGGFPVSASSSRTPALEAAGARSQLASVVAAACTLTLVLLVPGLTGQVPSAALAAVVVVAVTALVDVSALVRLARASRVELALSLAAFLGVVLLGAIRGVGVAVALSLLAFIAKAWRPHMTELVRVEQRKGYHDVQRHPDGRRIPGLVIARFDAPLFFANGATFDRFVRQLVEQAPQPVRWVVIAAEPITDVDVTAADELVELDEHLVRRGIHLVFAELKGPAKDRLARYGLTDRFGPERFFPTIGTAVSAYVRATATPWSDWEDRSQGGDS
jgi:high affinity sulfate transporter 1